MFKVMKMPYDYYDYFKSQSQNEEYSETTDKVKEKIWNETINFRLSQEWIIMEEKLLMDLYLLLRNT